MACMTHQMHLSTTYTPHSVNRLCAILAHHSALFSSKTKGEEAFFCNLSSGFLVHRWLKSEIGIVHAQW